MNEIKNPASNERHEQIRKFLLILARGEREIAAGEGYDLDAVMAEAKALLAEKPTA